MQRLFLALLFSMSLLESARGQNPVLMAQQLAAPADAMCRAAKGKPVTLAELGKLITRHHGMKVVIDEAAFRLADPKVDVASMRVTLPVKPGLKLVTVLQYVLENDLLVPGTFKLTKLGLAIGPGTTQVTQDEIKDGPVGKRLDATIMTSAADAKESVGAVLVKVEKATGLPILVANRQFVAAGKVVFTDQEVTVPKQNRVAAAKFLRDLLARVDATYLVKADHLLIVPKKK